MSRDPAASNDTEPKSSAESGDIRYDQWPLEGADEPDRNPTYLGLMNPEGGDNKTETSRAVFYDDRKEAIFEADVDETRERYVLREDTERKLEPADTLGDALEGLGDSLDWDSLSEFARERLQTDDEPADATTAQPPEPETVTFTQSNVDPDAAHDLEFSGAYDYRTDDGREVTVERTFEVALDDPDAPRAATVDVIDRVLRTDEAAGDPGSSGVDAEYLDERETTFEIDLEELEADRRFESRIEDRCEQWHIAHVEPPL